ncbi:MAG TPA: hypothetical protein VJK03_02140 [Candidatus Nanoarchaeia archaeon]|nr:hypothetical protein [Candidatus Nanoarchaeia archaeon]
MTYLPNQPTSASAFSEATHVLIEEYESIVNKYSLSLPASLRIEMQSFLQRNRILKSVDVVPEEDVCPDCLKAHLIKHAPLHGVLSSNIKILQKVLPGELGHDGHYLDGDKLKRIRIFRRQKNWQALTLAQP